jgi:hypothetical protein
VRAETPDERDDFAEIAFGWFGIGWFHQFQVECESLGFAAAFGRGVVLPVEQVERTGIKAVVVGLVLGRVGGVGVRGRGGGYFFMRQKRRGLC